MAMLRLITDERLITRVEIDILISFDQFFLLNLFVAINLEAMAQKEWRFSWFKHQKEGE